jgi:hypothetical protein
MLKSSISARKKVSRGRIKVSLVIAKVLKFRAIFLNQCFQENISRRYLLFEIHLLKNKCVAPNPRQNIVAKTRHTFCQISGKTPNLGLSLASFASRRSGNTFHFPLPFLSMSASLLKLSPCFSFQIYITI